MFLRDAETTNVPNAQTPAMSEPEKVLNDLLTTKQNLLAILSHATSMPNFETLNEPLGLHHRMNKLIDVTIDHLDAVNEQLRELRSAMIQKCHRATRNYQISLMGSVLSDGERYGINLDAIKKTAYVDGHISLVDCNTSNYEFPREISRLLTTAGDIFLNPDDIAAIVNSDTRIADIATEILYFIEANDRNLFMQFSPFAKYVYLQCIKALVTCIPAHDMIYFNRYLIHFDSVQGLVDHVYTLTYKAFDKASMSTANEWQFDPSAPNVNKPSPIPISFSNEHPITREERKAMLYPHKEDFKPIPAASASYNVRIMMLDVFTMIARLYKGFPE